MNKTFKKFLAILTTLTMVMSLFVITPAMAEEGEETPALTPAEKLWIDTNLFVNGDVEDGTINGSTQGEGYGNWGSLAYSGNSVTVTHSTAQAYSGDKSLLIKKPGDGWNLFQAYVYGTSMKSNTTYIANMKVLGTKKNANEGWATVANPNTQYENKVSCFLMNGQTHLFSGYTNLYTYSLKDLDDAPYADATEQPKADKSAWRDLGVTFTTGGSLNEFYGIAVKFLNHDAEFYTDDYYLGELMIAEVQNTTEASTVAIPESGDATLTLSAKAVNQLGTEAGLDGTTYTYKLLYPVSGVSVNNNVLTVSSEAQAQTIQVKATANPVFAGANEQSDELKARRSSIINIQLTKEAVEAPTTDIYEAYRNSNNAYTNGNLESGNLSTDKTVNLPTEGNWASQNGAGITTSLETKQAYSGNRSLLLTKTNSGTQFLAPYAYTGAFRANATYVASVMVLGTKANSTTGVENDPYANVAGYENKFYLYPYRYGTTCDTELLNKTKIIQKNLNQAPLASTENQEKLAKSEWEMLDYGFTIGESLPALLGFGIWYAAHGTELYTDDYYMSELVVANVDVTTDKNKVLVSDEAQTVTLTATAYNQLGNTKYLALNEESPVTYDYTLESAPAGVTVSDAGVITVPAGTAAGKIKVKVTAKPTFLGQDTQTDAQKALREKVVTIDVEAANGFNFNVTTPGYVTPQAFVDKALENDAKAYCALYKLLDGGAKKLMAITSAPLAAGSTSVELDEIEIPTTYDYEIKGFLWYEGTMKNVIPAEIWE